MKIIYLLILLLSPVLLAEKTRHKFISKIHVKAVELAFAGDGGSVSVKLIDSQKKAYYFLIDGRPQSPTKGKVFVNKKLLNKSETNDFKNLLFYLMKKDINSNKKDLKQAIQTIN